MTGEEAWCEITNVFALHAIGKLSFEDARWKIEATALRAHIEQDERVISLLAAMNGAEAKLRRSRERIHDARNALAGVLASLDVMTAGLGRDLELEALEHAILAAKRLHLALQPSAEGLVLDG